MLANLQQKSDKATLRSYKFDFFAQKQTQRPTRAPADKKSIVIA